MKPSDSSRMYFNRAADLIDMENSTRKMLLIPKREVQVQIPIEMDDGQRETFIGYRVQHDNSRGPMKGGFRYHPEVDLDEVRSLAALMTLEDGGRGHLPYGGAKGASRSIRAS